MSSGHNSRVQLAKKLNINMLFRILRKENILEEIKITKNKRTINKYYNAKCFLYIIDLVNDIKKLYPEENIKHYKNAVLQQIKEEHDSILNKPLYILK